MPKLRARSVLLPLAIAQLIAGCPSSNVISTDAPPIQTDTNLDPCAATDVDLLFMIDNSGSMREEQENLIRELPRMVQALTTGDRDDDGMVDFAPVRSLHIGFITSDMGSGNQTDVRTCAPGLGHDGLLRRTSASEAPCMPTYPSGTFAFNPSDDVTGFIDTVSCVASVGTEGCGFEQPLEAALKALTPANPEIWTAVGYSPPRFYDPASGTRDRLRGHGSNANAGFIRPDSTLAIILLTDEEDCSLADYALIGNSDTRFATIPPNVRCNTYSGDTSIVYPVSRYIDGFLGLRRSPRQLIFSVIAGIPIATEEAASRGDYATVLTHPEMVPYIDESGSFLTPSCSSANGVAYPPVRLVETAAGLGTRGVNLSLSSICNRTFTAPITDIIGRISSAIPSTCL